MGLDFNGDDLFFGTVSTALGTVSTALGTVSTALGTTHDLFFTRSVPPGPYVADVSDQNRVANLGLNAASVQCHLPL